MRTDLEGTYEMEEVIITYYFLGSPVEGEFPISNNLEIEIETDRGLKNNELGVDLEEFIKILAEEFTRLRAPEADYEIDIDGDAIAQLNEDELNISNYMFDFDLSAGNTVLNATGELDMEGKIEDDELTFSFRVLFYFRNEPTIFRGRDEGER